MFKKRSTRQKSFLVTPEDNTEKIDSYNNSIVNTSFQTANLGDTDGDND